MTSFLVEELPDTSHLGCNERSQVVDIDFNRFVVQRFSEVLDSVKLKTTAVEGHTQHSLRFPYDFHVWLLCRPLQEILSCCMSRVGFCVFLL